MNTLDPKKKKIYAAHFERLDVATAKKKKLPRRRRGRPPKPKTADKPEPTLLPPVQPTNLPDSIMGVDVVAFLQLLQSKRGDDQLFRAVDELQARMAFANLSIIENIQKSISDDGYIKSDERTKIINAIKSASTSVNDTFKSLGLSYANRDEESESNSALTTLAEEDLEDNMPPTLQYEFLSAKKDIEEIAGDLSEEEEEKKQKILAEIKSPISMFEEKAKKTVETNVDEEGVKELA